ncbi:MAG: hypothetical protein QOF18_2552 [Frankiaceae bacterium]|jgi:hypothetical protein|nr:hypothetical protein [Frankiaceae bacterium]
MGDKPAKYWDHEQCAWARCPDAADASAPPDDLVVPEQATIEQESVGTA